MRRQAVLALALAAVGALLPCACSTARPRRPRDVVSRVRANADAGAPPESTVAAPPEPLAPRREPAGASLKLLVRASCRALALGESNVYYGNNDDDAVFRVAKVGGDPVRLARRAPVAGALAIEGSQLAWVATPGDVVLRLDVASALDGGAASASTVRDRGIFADVALSGGDVFVAEVVGGGSAVTRTAGTKVSRIASFDGSARAIAVDATHVYIATATKLLRAPRDRGDVEVLASGPGFDSPVLDADAAYVVATTANGQHDVVRIPKAHPETHVLVADVRAAPIAVQGGELFYFDGHRSRLLALRVGGGTPRVIAADEALARPSALAVDATTVYVATGEREDGAVSAVPREPPAATAPAATPPAAATAP